MLKEGVNGDLKGAQPPCCPHNCGGGGFNDPAHAIWWVAETFPYCKTRNVAGANMQWGCFVCPSCSQKRESTAFELVLHVYEVLGDFRVPVSKLVEVVIHVGEGAKFGVEKVNNGQNICSRDASVGNGKNFEKQAQWLIN